MVRAVVERAESGISVAMHVQYLKSLNKTNLLSTIFRLQQTDEKVIASAFIWRFLDITKKFGCPDEFSSSILTPEYCPKRKVILNFAHKLEKSIFCMFLLQQPFICDTILGDSVDT